MYYITGLTYSTLVELYKDKNANDQNLASAHITASRNFQMAHDMLIGMKNCPISGSEFIASGLLSGI
jgi:hypothetical protein